MTTLELLKEAIEVGHPRDAQALVYQCLEEGLSSSEIIDQAMIPAMKSAGEYYKNNDADIPRILSAARSVRKAYDILQEKFGSLEDESLGTIILGTVEGDLHDVGKKSGCFDVSKCRIQSNRPWRRYFRKTIFKSRKRKPGCLYRLHFFSAYHCTA